MDKPEALRLAEMLEQDPRSKAHRDEAAAELRRLHKENELLASAADKLRMVWRDEVHCLMQDKRQLIAQRDALLEALKKMRHKYGEYACSVCDHADAAIKAVEKGK